MPLFERNADEEIEVTATCNNLVTARYVTRARFQLLLNDINVESLSSPTTPDWWRNVTHIDLVLSTLYSDADVTVSMGDGHDCIFSTTHADDRCSFEATHSPTSVTIVLTYVYDWWGVYTVTLAASNGIPAYDVTGVTTSVELWEWTCNPPSISFDENLLQQPYRPIQRSLSRSIELASLHLDCMKSYEVAFEWRIFDLNENELTDTITPQPTLNSPQLQLPVNSSLSYGMRAARVRVSMVIDESVFGVSDPVFVEGEGRFRYTSSERIAMLESQGWQSSKI